MNFEIRAPLTFDPSPEYLNFINSEIECVVKEWLRREGLLLDTETPHSVPGLRLAVEYQPPNLFYKEDEVLHESILEDGDSTGLY